MLEWDQTLQWENLLALRSFHSIKRRMCVATNQNVRPRTIERPPFAVGCGDDALARSREYVNVAHARINMTPNFKTIYHYSNHFLPDINDVRRDEIQIIHKLLYFMTLCAVAQLLIFISN